MATQDVHSIPFEISNEQQHFRLLELPPSLLEPVMSKRLPNLTMKSASGNLSFSSQASANAVLCTDDQTFQVRQVHSSNSVFVLQPFEAQSQDGSISSTSLRAIAQCAATLELIPATSSPEACLRTAIRLHPQSVASDTSTRAPSRDELLEEAPFSSAEFRKAWIQLCAFEDDGQARLPTASGLIGLWKSIVAAATVRSLDLSGSFPVGQLAGVVEEDGHTRALFQAVIARLSAHGEESANCYAMLDREQTVSWVGMRLLESHNGSKSTAISDFMKDWQNQLPEIWREDAALDVLKGKYVLPNKSTIMYDDSGAIALNAAASTSVKSEHKASKNNWHEKFKNTRR